MSGFVDGLGGIGPHGNVFEPASWVDLKLPPGHTSLGPRCASSPLWFLSPFPRPGVFGIGAPFFFSPNLVWVSIALAIYVLFPYEDDFAAAESFEARFLAKRLAINLVVGFAYIGFWHVSLYVAKAGKRKFDPTNEGPSAGRLFHNIWFTLLGLLQWTAWEVAFIHLFATGKIAYVSDSTLISSPLALLSTLLCVLSVPVFHDLHFYFAHRLVHLRPLYTFVHSLHHRNKDPEPFAGMCMHPVEHLYYLSNVGFSLLVPCSPFLVTWNLVFSVLAPAAGHSGFEDHWQSDQFHHLHHQYFECNYGNLGIPFDKWFGTLRLCLDAKDSTGENSGAVKKYLRNDVVSASDALPKRPDHWLFWAFTLALFVAIGFAAQRSDPNVSFAVAVLASVGPIAFAFLLAARERSSQSLLWPFHKEKWLGSLGFHTVLGVLFSVIPVFATIRNL